MILSEILIISIYFNISNYTLNNERNIINKWAILSAVNCLKICIIQPAHLVRRYRCCFSARSHHISPYTIYTRIQRALHVYQHLQHFRLSMWRVAPSILTNVLLFFTYYTNTEWRPSRHFHARKMP